MRCTKLALFTLLLVLIASPAFSTGVLTPAATDGGGLPAVGSEGDCMLTTSGAWSAGACPGAGSGAPTNSQYWTGAADATLSAEKNLGALGTGLVINTAGVPSIYAGATCTNQVVRILGASGAATCATITSAFVDTSVWTGSVSSGLLKASSQGVLAQATAGTDYVAPGGALGTPSSGTLTNATGLPISTGVSGLGTGVATFLATPSSANLASALTNETGSGAAVFGTAPTLDAAVMTTKVNLPRVTALPGTPATGDTVIVTDDSAAGACDSAAGSATSMCQYNGSAWVAIGDGNSGSGAPTNATYIVQTANGSLSNEQALGALSTGCLGSATTTGVLSARTITGTANQITVTNGDCSGNPTISIPSSPTISGTVTADGFTATGAGIGKMTLLEGTAPSAPGTAGQHTVYFDSTSHYLSSIVNGGSAVKYFSTIGGWINSLTSKATPTTSDLLAIEDAAASNATKKITLDGALAANDARTKTLTNTTMDVEGTGNVFTIPRRIWFPAAGCNNATAGSVWDLPTSNPAVAACKTGTNTQMGVLDFADGSNLSAQLTHKLPSTWTGAIDANIKWLTSATTGDVVWQLSTICVADAETDDPAFNTASTVTDTAKGTTLQTNDASITGVTATGCAAGELMHLKIQRDSAHASDTLAATARLIGIELVIREAL